jgi:hypothetical protein
VGEADRRAIFLHVLTTGARRSKDVDSDVVRVDRDLNVVDFR